MGPGGGLSLNLYSPKDRDIHRVRWRPFDIVGAWGRFCQILWPAGRTAPTPGGWSAEALDTSPAMLCVPRMFPHL